jgi:formylglycine-generating enzyme required for sulfatase activity
MSSILNACLLALLLCLAVDAAASEPGAAREFRDCAECPQMVVVPAGVFIMGGKPEPRINFKPEPDEVPQRSVAVASYAMGKYEVTQAEWRAVMGENPSDYDDGTGVLPVETVSWNDAQEYVRRLSLRTGRQYRLPTEAEWEYAARAGSTSLFSFGDDVSELGQHAWYGGNSGGHIHPVGLKQANAFGLHDMHGNVWEWVEDCYQPSYVGAPVDGSAMPRSPPCQRNNRGGSWVNSPLNLRSHHRHKMGAGSRGTFVGVRVAATLGEAGSRPISK